jgi:hypothetical protein
MGPCESERPRTHEKHVIGTSHDGEGNSARCLDVAESRHRSGKMLWSIHDARVELDNAIGIRKPPVANAHVVRVHLDQVDACHCCIDGALARGHLSYRQLRRA